MSIISRRAILAGIAASPALALPAVASIGPDSELLRLEAEHDAARAEAKRISDRIEELTDGLPEWARGGIPLYPTAEPPFCNMGRLSLSETLYGWRVGANRVMLMPDGRCSHAAVVCAHRLMSLKSAA